MEKFILNHADVVSTISEGMRKKILRKTNKLNEVLIFPNWVDDTKVFNQTPDKLIIKSLGIPLNKKIFFYSGSIGEKQGLEILLNIAPLIAEECPDLLFLISGNGPYRKDLENKMNRQKITNILFIDLQPDDLFNHLLNFVHCHLVIQNGKSGDLLLPSKLSNILAVGGLCIVTASPETSLYKIVYDNQIGLLCPPNDSKELTNIILKIYPQL